MVMFKNPFAAFKWFTKELFSATAKIDDLQKVYDNYLKKVDVLFPLYYCYTGYREFLQLHKLGVNKATLLLANKTLQNKQYIDPEYVLQLYQKAKEDVEFENIRQSLQQNFETIQAYIQTYFPFATKQDIVYIYLLFRDKLFETNLLSVLTEQTISENIIFIDLANTRIVL